MDLYSEVKRRILQSVFDGDLEKANSQLVRVSRHQAIGDFLAVVLDDRIKYSVGDLNSFSIYFDDYEGEINSIAISIESDFLEILDDWFNDRILLWQHEDSEFGGVASGCIKLTQKISEKDCLPLLKRDLSHSWVSIEDPENASFYLWSGPVSR